MSKENPLGMYGEREELKAGKYHISFFSGKEEDGIWIRLGDGEGMQLSGKSLEKYVDEMWKVF